MSRSVSILAAAMLALVPFLAQAEDGYLRSIQDFQGLEDHQGNTHSLSDYRDKDYLVIYMHGVGCPIARLAVPPFQEVQAGSEEAGHDVAFLMLNASIQDTLPRIREEAGEFGVQMPILKDADQSVAQSLGVERTAEVFIVDPRTRETVFRGPVNDRLGYETQRMEAKEHYLRDSLDTLLAGGEIDMSQIPDSKGCLIGFF